MGQILITLFVGLIVGWIASVLGAMVLLFVYTRIANS